MSGIDLANFDLTGSTLRKAELSEANLNGAILRRLAEIKYPRGCDMLEEWRYFHRKPSTS
jgi:uncharacterized protein YjbI with pentapeptide repeats